VSGGSITLEANYYYNSGWYPEADNFLHQKHYNLVTASIGWTSADERYWVRAWGKNLTDAAVATQIASSFLSTVVAYQPPRTYGLEAGVKF
jgi:iron complex outermembrane receptor protein